MSELKNNHNKKLSSVDKDIKNSFPNPLRYIIANHKKFKQEEMTLDNTNKSAFEINNNGLTTTNHSLSKLVKTNLNRSLERDNNPMGNDISEIVNKYEDLSIYDKKSLSKKMEEEISIKPETEENKVKIELDSQEKIKIPILDFNKISERLNFEEQELDELSQNDSSFVNDISINQSIFNVDDENKNVNLCISNLEFDNTSIIGKKLNFNKGRNLKLNEIRNTVTEFDEVNNHSLSTLNHQNENKKLIDNKEKGGCNKHRKIFLIFLASLGLIALILSLIAFN